MSGRREREKRAAAAGVPRVDPGSPAIPRWVPATLFAVLTLFVFRAFVFSHGMLKGSDTLSMGYAARLFYAEQLRAGTFPLWAPQILGGTPFLEALSGGDALYPTSLLLLVMEPFRALGWKLVLHVFLAGLFMYGWIRTIGGSKAAALVSGTAYMLAPFLVSLVRPGHDGKLFVTALTPLLYWMVERFFRRPRPSSFSLVAFVVALVLLTTHFQMAYFLFLSVGAYALFRSVQIWRGTGSQSEPVKPGRRRARRASLRFALFLAASVAGLGVAAVQFVPAARYVTEYSRRTQTTRQEAGDVGVEWASSWSLHPEEAMGLLVPEFAGNNAGGAAWATGTYWGRNFTKDNAEYAGILVLILAAASFGGREKRGLRRFFIGSGLVALLFALGAHTPVWYVFYAAVPGIRLFRSASMAAFLFGFGAATLAGLGLDRILGAARSEDGSEWRRVQRTLWAAAGVLVVLAVGVSSGALESFWTSTVYPQISPGGLRKLEVLTPYIARGAWLGAILGVFTAVLAWALRAGKLAPAGLVAIVLILVVADEARIDAPFIQVIDFATFEQWASPDANMRALLEREQGSDEPYRLLSFANRAQDVHPALYGIELAAGHHPNDLARYRELIGMMGSDLPRNLFNLKIQRLLNVRYLLWPDHNGPGPRADSVVHRSWVDGKPYETLYAWPGLPRARLVAKVVVKPEPEQVPYMLSDAFRPDSEVVLSEPPPISLEGGPVEGSVAWQVRTPNRLRLSVTSDRPALLVVADNWYPAWHATVDGKPAPVLRAYHTLRAIPVTAGRHEVEMVYHAGIVAWSLRVSLVVILLLLGSLGWEAVQARRSPSPNESGEGPGRPGRSR